MSPSLEYNRTTFLDLPTPIIQQIADTNNTADLSSGLRDEPQPDLRTRQQLRHQPRHGGREVSPAAGGDGGEGWDGGDGRGEGGRDAGVMVVVEKIVRPFSFLLPFSLLPTQ